MNIFILKMLTNVRAKHAEKLAVILQFVEYPPYICTYTYVYRSPRSEAKKTSGITEECSIENSSDEGWIAA